MNRVAAVGWLAGLLAVAAAAQAPVQPFGSTERVEAGQLRSPSGVVEHYRIRLLPVDSFPSLPPGVATRLTSLGCMIPQSFEAQQPENVIHGSFRAPGSSDWAALCSVSGTTTLYVFFAGRYGSPEALRSQTDTAWLGHEPGSSTWGLAWGIATRSLSDLRESSSIQAAFPLDHDAIDDSRLEQSDIIRYFHHGQWMILLTSDFS